MNVKEFYDAVGGGYAEMSAKFADDTIVIFLKIFARDNSFDDLKVKLGKGDTDGAFAAVHTLKGVVLNLNIGGLIGPACAVTEALRARNLGEAADLMPALESAYKNAKAQLAVLLESL